MRATQLCQPDALLKQQRRKVRQLRRKVRRQLPKHAVDMDVTIEKDASELVASDVQVDVGEASTSGREHAHETGAVPLAGRKRDLDSLFFSFFFWVEGYGL